LSLFGHNLRELPEWLGKLTKLRWLNLAHNSLQQLPQGLAQLKQLQSLNLARNELNALPEWLCELTRLRILDLNNNKIRMLPEGLGQLRQLQSLIVFSNRLTVLPEGLVELKQLRSLDLCYNRLQTLPEAIGELGQLQSLMLSQNELAALPDSLGKLVNLERLDLDGNALATLPEFLVGLTGLKVFWLGVRKTGNPFGSLPPIIRKMQTLKTLGLAGCGLETLPEWIGELALLERLDIDRNQLQRLPLSLVQLPHLRILDLVENPLTPELIAASWQGFDAVRRYLRELAKGSRRRYEAKLLILGDGNEGKTCVSRAIRGLPFEPQVSTRGVDVEQWKFGHPDRAGDSDDKEITLNIWDFEGQEINHQTHQFFLTTQALYLLVFKCRDQFLLDRAEYWLDTIRARAPNAKVAIVITHCEEKTPYVPEDKLHRYRDLLVEGKWLFAVGCADNSGIRELQDQLKGGAANLEFMGREWPDSYSKAEAAIKEKARDGSAYISRAQLYEIFRGCDIDESIFKDLGAAMSNLGVVTQFPDCPDLRDFIVLQPQWLTKAISEIMEDRQLAADKGELSLRRMEAIWEDKGYAGLFPTFHNCMKEFELCYDLEDASRSCLVPLRFGYEKPPISLTNVEGRKERRVEYTLNIRPPTGIMSRFIVKTHHMMVKTIQYPKGVYWHNGVFLRTGTGRFASEALCEFDSDVRKLRIKVWAAFPQNLLEQIHGYVKSVFSFFSGLDPERSYGCMKFSDDTDAETTCEGLHTERRIYSEILNHQLLNCEHSFHRVDPRRLIFGFSSFGEFVLDKPALVHLIRNELDRKPEWVESLAQNIGRFMNSVEERQEGVEQLIQDRANLLPEIKQELELKLHEYLSFTSQMLDDREQTAAPGIVSVTTKDRSKWNPASYFTKTYFLTPYCECPDNIHSCEDGRVEFTRDRDWWERTAPHIARGTRLLAAGLQLAFAGMPLALGPQLFDSIKEDVKFMNELTKHLELKANNQSIAGSAEVFKEDFGEDLRGREESSRLMRISLARFLEETAATNYRARQWGSLRRLRMSDNSYRWMCETHASEHKA
jgi:GTPase SAR1 family protein